MLNVNGFLFPVNPDLLLPALYHGGKHIVLMHFNNQVKGKVWSKTELHRLVLCIKDRQSAIFVKAKQDFLT